jgi:hypothetical protein
MNNSWRAFLLSDAGKETRLQGQWPVLTLALGIGANTNDK